VEHLLLGHAYDEYMVLLAKSGMIDTDSCRRLDWLSWNTTRVLRSWTDCSIVNVQAQFNVAKEVVHLLKMAHDYRTLANHEELRQLLKLKLLGL
jgi:hypothetical protein